MKFGLVSAAAIVAFVLVVFQPAFAQTSYHQLKAEEFEGAPDFTSKDNIAFTNCFIDFNYHAKSEKGGTVMLTCDIKLVFDHEKSWINKRRVPSAQIMDQILNHEQGHYTIAYMEQQELLRTINKTRFDSNFQAEAEDVFNRIHEKYKQLTVDYDEDTAHMQNRAQQHSWDNYFQKRLAYMPQSEIASNR